MHGLHFTEAQTYAIPIHDIIMLQVATAAVNTALVSQWSLQRLTSPDLQLPLDPPDPKNAPLDVEHYYTTDPARSKSCGCVVQ